MDVLEGAGGFELLLRMVSWAVLVGPQVWCCPLLHQVEHFCVGSVDVNIWRLAQGEGRVRAQQVMSAA